MTSKPPTDQTLQCKIIKRTELYLVYLYRRENMLNGKDEFHSDVINNRARSVKRRLPTAARLQSLTARLLGTSAAVALESFTHNFCRVIKLQPHDYHNKYNQVQTCTLYKCTPLSLIQCSLLHESTIFAPTTNAMCFLQLKRLG